MLFNKKGAICGYLHKHARYCLMDFAETRRNGVETDNRMYCGYKQVLTDQLERLVENRTGLQRSY